MHPPVGVIGVGAMGLGVVQRLARSGFQVLARDIRPEADAAAAAAGAIVCATPAELARRCPIVILLVVDAAQIDAVLFGEAGAAGALSRDAVVVVSSTVAPSSVAALERRLTAVHARVIDAPVSGGPQRAADGTLTMMISGDARAIDACEAVFGAISAKRFLLGNEPGKAAAYKILNNQLAAANLVAGAEAMTIALRAGLDPRRFLEVVNASSGASWIVGDRMPRALAADHFLRAATRILHKDVALAVDAATELGIDAPLARMARDTFAAAMEAGYGEADDAALLAFCYERAGVKAPRNT